MLPAHAKLGPSSADRWWICSGSVHLIDSLISRGVVSENESSVYADEGTVAHEIREMSLLLGLEPSDFIGETRTLNGVTYTVDEDMAHCLQEGIDWIREQTSEPHVEVRVDLSPWLPGQFGTMDSGWLTGKTLYVSDLKYGAGEPVSPVENRQQMLYALGFWHYIGRPEVEKIVINIDQPRAGGMKFWDCSFERLMEFATEVEAAYDRIMNQEPVFVPTEKGCRWCKAREPRGSYPGCSAYNDWMFSYFADVFDDLDGDEAPRTDMTPERRWEIVSKAKLITKWLADLHESSLQAALEGNPDPGSKVVVGQRGNRFFRDSSQAEAILKDALGDEAFKPRELITLTQAEKLLKPGKKKPGDAEAWSKLDALIEEPDGKPILVPETDAREAIKPLADVFDDLPETEGN